MRRADAVRLVKEAAKKRRLVFAGHALDEMDDEGETRESVAVVVWTVFAG
jgi:hypothetical protein